MRAALELDIREDRGDPNLSRGFQGINNLDHVNLHI